MRHGRACVLIAGLALALGGDRACGEPVPPAGQQRADDTPPPPHPRILIDQEIQQAQKKIEASPGDPELYVELAEAFMQKARETGDASYLARAEAACGKALKLDSNSYPAIRTLPWIYNTQHRFHDGAAAARRGLALNRHDPMNYARLGDALIELGRYDDAEEAYLKMAHLGRDLASVPRLAHLRFLRGDVPGAIERLRRAADATPESMRPEHRAWFLLQLGNLHLGQGQLDEAEPLFTQALEAFPEYHPALTSLAALRAARKHYDQAIALYQRSIEIAPAHDAVVGLGDLYLALGREDDARRQFALIEVVARINQAGNVRPDWQMVLFYADHDRELPLALRMAEDLARERQDIRTCDALAWALYKNGHFQEALAAINDALRLGTPDARLHFHAGMIRSRLGQAKEAEVALATALQINPEFHPLQAEGARTALRELRESRRED